MSGHRFTKFIPDEEGSAFDKLLKLFFKLLPYTNGDVAEALQWMTELDRQYQLTTPEYSMGNFIDELREKGYIKDNDDDVLFELTAKSEQTLRQNALDEIFGKLKKSQQGSHRTFYSGRGDEIVPELRPFQFGDSHETINYTHSIMNAHINHGIDDFSLTENDLEIQEREYKTQHATVLMIDLSHSMILYGEDRITPAKKVAMALAELIRIKYPKDLLDIIAFGDDAWPVTVKQLPYLQVGPYHTNTVAGLELALDLLRRRKVLNKQIFMITDGKPTCLKEGNRYYKNSFGLDRKILNRCYNMAAQCKRLNISITTFMIAKDPHLQQFVREFTQINNGRAFYSSLNGLGEFIFEDYIRNRRKTIR